METSDAQAVNRAAEWVSTVPVGHILYEAVQIAEWGIVPHVCGAPALASAYRWADRRKPISIALAARLEAALHEPLDLENQEWWTTSQRRLSRGMSYDDDSLLWTVQNLPARVHDAVVDAWDHGGNTSRWHIAVKGQPRIKEIHRPADWIELVERYPGPPVKTSYHLCWKFKSPNSSRRLTWAPTGKVVFGWLGRLYDRRPRLVPRDGGLSELLAQPGQKAAQPLSNLAVRGRRLESGLFRLRRLSPELGRLPHHRRLRLRSWQRTFHRATRFRQRTHPVVSGRVRRGDTARSPGGIDWQLQRRHRHRRNHRPPTSRAGLDQSGSDPRPSRAAAPS